MELLDFVKIQVPEDRVRKEFDNDYLDNLAEDIATNGLYHPLVLRNEADILVAGQNRLRAINVLLNVARSFFCNGELVPLGKVPVIRLSKLPPEQLLEVELNENLLRRDITWQERVAGIAKLHRFRKQQNPDQTMGETASEVLHRPAKSFDATVTVGNAIALEPYLNDPEIRSAPTQKEAFKRVSKKMERLIVGELANLADADQEKNLEKGKEKSPHELALGDCLDLLIYPHYQGRFDLILTDPPYAIDANSFGDQAKTAHRYEDSAEQTLSLLQDFCAETKRIAKPDAHLYMFCAFEYFKWLQEQLTDAGWTVWHRPFIWHKGNSGMLPAPQYGPRQTYECLLYARRGNKMVVKQGQQDVLTYLDSTEVEHAAQKPPELFADLIARSCLPGESVLDPFCGRGTIFTAADMCKVKACGIEKDEEMFKLAHGRLHGI